MSHRQEKDKGVNVQVLLRCRPFSEGELRANTPQVVTCAEFQREVSVTTSVHGKHTERVFTFDKVFGPTTRQRDLYNEAVVPIVNEVLEGFNCTIFAYGQTGTGKTFTMEGECRMSKSGSKGELPQNAGVIPRAVKQIFETLESQNAEYSVKVTFLELYNEEITDLLAPEDISKVAAEEKQRKPLPLMEDGKGGVLVRGLEEEIVTSANEIFTLLERGSAKRRTAETMLNKQSSRSHSLFSITIHIKEATPEGEELIKCGKLNLVDLAGSENVTRAGAGQGRAREAGEINKSLLTLGRVINALLEHQGHIPYRDSKLTRLLRDSLGGRTKTCIIATVAPSVHCLEETLSTLDYAHRAKNIKNKPEVNQKMTKQTLIKDLYSEIDRLKAEVYATREKVGVYLPKERYEREENERKSMAERIEQMTTGDETNQKRIEELEKLYGAGCKKLEACEKTLEETSKLLAVAREDLTRSQYSLKEKEFVICELKMAENALTKQAYELQAKLEKSVQENHLLFSKIAREDRLTAANKTTVNNFQGDLVENISSLCGLVVSSINQQKQQLLQIEGMGKSFIDYHDKSLSELKKRVCAAQVQYVSHLDEFQNDVRLQKADINGTLDEISLMSCANHKSLDHVLAVGDGLADQIIKDLKDTLSSQKEEAARFAQDIRERFYRSIEDTKCMSNSMYELLEKIADETSKLRHHANVAHDILTQEITDIRTKLREKRRLESEQLLSNFHKQFLSLQSQHQDMLDVELLSVMEKVTENKVLVDTSTSSTGVTANDTKRKWETFAVNAETLYNEGAESISAKHSRMSLFYQQCAASVDTSLKHWKDTNKSVKEMATKHLAGVDAFVRTIVDANEEHDRKIASSRIVAEKDVAIGCDDIVLQFEGVVEHDHETVSRMMDTLNSQALTLHNLDETHTACTSDILKLAENTFRDSYEDYEPTGETPVRSEPEVPSKCTIESLRAMPMDVLEEDFRENNPYVSTKEPKPSLIPRSPLIPRN